VLTHATLHAPVEAVGCRLRLWAETLFVEDDSGGYSPAVLPVLSLAFRGGDAATERRIRQLVERHGALELECIDGCISAHDSKAEYVLSVDGNVHAICSFSAHALPELEREGVEVEIDPDYPWRLVDAGALWTAKLEPIAGQIDWFCLELGIEIDGRHVDLLPALTELLEQSPEGASLDALARHAARSRALRVGDGLFVAIPWERLRRVLSVLVDLYGNRALHAAQAHTLAELDAALEGAGIRVRWQGDGAEPLLERGRALVRGPAFTARPVALRAELRPYQQEGLAWMCQLGEQGLGGVLADDMGLGKTLQTIALLAHEKEARRMDRPSLVVMPTSLVENWKRELNRFAPHLRLRVLHGARRHQELANIARAEIVLTTYPVLVRDLERLRGQSWHYLVLDEAQAIKNPRSLASRAVRALDARHRLCLTGTPLENNLEELWSLFDFLSPGLLGPAERFRAAFRVPIERDGDAFRLAALRERVAPYVLRRVKESVAHELPPKTELMRAISLEREQRDLYESIRVAAHGEVRRAIRQKGIAGAAITILDALTQLRQVCCDPRLVRVQAARSVTRSAKGEAFFELLDSELACGRKVLVFSQFARMLALLSQGLHQRAIGHVLLTGASDDRQALVDAFQGGEVDVFLISLKAGGTGLNLTRADTVIHYDPWWNAAAQMQATDRAHRIGQTKPVFVHNLVIAGSVEERMLELQQRKRRLAETLLGSEQLVSRLDAHAVEDLFAPLPE
jgi:superfamily II DNA or RNA helicase